ncbi:ABC transporter substrate-binding protein [Trichloromonas sp.]|uniref:ABC transporter substrate-binding protein n=1 Tax=Trichloromonas sp. TaxID=3069249 RepID=UPI003D812BBB
MSWRGFFCAIALTAAIGGFAACKPDPPIKLGFVGGLSGRVADLGVSGRNGVMLAIEQRNAAGGIHGRLVTLIVRDDEQDPEVAKYVMEKLLQEQVEAVIGPMTSSMAMAMVPLANEAKTLLVSPTANAAELTGLDDYYFRVVSDTRTNAERIARFQFDQLGHRTAVVMYDLANKAYAESWLNDFRTEFEKLGGTIRATCTFVSGADTPYYDMVWELLEHDPDFALVIANSVDAALICQQIRKTNDELPIALAEWAATERFIELAGSASNHIYVAHFIDRDDDSQQYQDFLAAYQQRFGQNPGFAGLAGYDAAQVVLEGLTRRSSGQSLKSTLLALGDFAGVQQRISFDRFGDTNRTAFFSVIRNGHYQALE